MQQTQDIIISLLSLLIIISIAILRLLEATNVSIEDVLFMPQKGRIFRKFGISCHLRDVENDMEIIIETR